MAKKNLSPEGKSESGARGMMPRVTSISNIRAGAGNAAREALYNAKFKAMDSYKAPKFNTTNPMLGTFKSGSSALSRTLNHNFKASPIGKYTGGDMALIGTIGVGTGVAVSTIANDRYKAQRKRAKAIKKASVKTRKGQSAGR